MPITEEKTERSIIIIHEDNTTSKLKTRLLAHFISEQIVMENGDSTHKSSITQLPYEETYIGNNDLFFKEIMSDNPYAVIFFNENYNVDIKHICENFSSQYKDVICIHVQHSSEPWATFKISGIHIINNYIELNEVAKQISEIILLDTMVLDLKIKCTNGEITTEDLASTPPD